MASGWFYVRDKNGIFKIEEIILKLSIIMEFDRFERDDLVEKASELLKLHDENFSASEVHFEIIEEDGRHGLKLLFKFKGGVYSILEDGGIIVKQLLPSGKKLSEVQLQKIEKELSKISEEDIVDLLKSYY